MNTNLFRQEIILLDQDFNAKKVFLLQTKISCWSLLLLFVVNNEPFTLQTLAKCLYAKFQFNYRCILQYQQSLTYICNQFANHCPITWRNLGQQVRDTPGALQHCHHYKILLLNKTSRYYSPTKFLINRYSQSMNKKSPVRHK